MYLGIDIGGTNLKSGIVDENGNLIEQLSIPTNAENGPDAVINNIKNIIQEARNNFPDLKSVGIGVPGVVTDEGVVRISPNLPGWVDQPLKKKLTDIISIPIAIDNDANTAAVAELELGAGKGLNNFIYITLGTGVGGAIIINRNIFRGDTGGAGEIGDTIKQRALPTIASRAELRKAHFTKDAGIIGAALLGKKVYNKM